MRKFLCGLYNVKKALVIEILLQRVSLVIACLTMHQDISIFIVDPEGLVRTMSASETHLHYRRSSSKNEDASRVEAVRRSSNGSNESNGKKQASLNEIQDLYSALQDLVTSNVTATPLPTRNQNVRTSATDDGKGSPQLESRDSPTHISSTNGRKMSDKDSPDSKSKNFKRGLSADNVVSSLLKKSPFPSRKLSHDVIPSCNESTKHTRKHTRSSSAASEKVKKDAKIFRRGSNADSKSHKRWKPKLFLRKRSKSTVGLNDEEEKLSSEDGAETPPSLLKARRSSEADVNRINNAKSSARKKHSKQLSCPPVRKQRDLSKSVSSLCTENVKDIDQLVAALNLEYGDDKFSVSKNARTSYKSPEGELSKLESWFEKAAAEAVMYQSRVELDDDYDRDQTRKTRRASNDVGKEKNRRISASKLTIKRGNSAGRMRPDKKRFTRSPRNDKSTERMRINSLGHARSTPNLRDYTLDSPVSSGAESTECCDETKDKSSPGRGKLSKNISFDENVRLPRAPLFYMPENEDAVSDRNKLLINKSLIEEQQNQLIEKFFYNGEDKENCLKSQQEAQHLSDSVVQIKQYQNGIDKASPKSVLTPGCYIELKIDASALKTDDNANFCQNGGKEMICDMNNTIGDKNSMWSRYHNPNENKKVKAIMT